MWYYTQMEKFFIEVKLSYKNAQCTWGSIFILFFFSSRSCGCASVCRGFTLYTYTNQPYSEHTYLWIYFRRSVQRYTYENLMRQQPHKWRWWHWHVKLRTKVQFHHGDENVVRWVVKWFNKLYKSLNLSLIMATEMLYEKINSPVVG